MRLWGRIIVDNKTVYQAEISVAAAYAHEISDWGEPIGELCRELDLSRPIILGKHLREISAFSRAVFKPADFVEPVSFDKFDVEIIIDKKHKNSHT